MTMKRFAQAALALLFLLPAVPVAEATHLVPRDVDPQLPNIAEEPIFDTNIKPLRDLQIEAATAANRSLNPGRTGLDLAQERAEAEAWAQPLPGQVTLFTDRFEGDRLGAYGHWGEVGPNSWGIRTGIDNVTTTGILAKGRYPANAQSLLTTPELDLRTGFVDPVTNGGWQATGPVAGPAQETYADGSQAYAEARKSVPPFNSQGVGTDNLPKTLPQPEVPVGLSAIYRTIYQAIDNVVNAPATVSDGIVCAPVPQVGKFCVPGPGGAVGGLDTDSRDGAYVLEFQRRFNLARNGELEGRDGVRVLVFTQQPTLELAARCMEAADLGNRPANFVGQAPAFVASGPAGDEDAQGNPTQPGAIDPHCTVPRMLERDTAPTPLPTKAFDNNPTDGTPSPAAFTGYDDWRASAIDLTPWAERSVWVGFLFASGNAAGDPYFRNPALFNLDEDRNAEFFGYELDDLRLTAPGMAHSVRVRPIDDPWYVPFGHDLPTLALGDPLPIGTDIANVGTRPVDINLTVRVLNRSDNSLVWSRDLGTVHLDPRGVHRVDETALDVTGNAEQYQVVVDALRSRSTGDAPEADPRDSIQTQDVDVRTVRHLVPGNVERSAATFAGGDTASFTLRLRNEGNAPVETVAVADLVNVVSGSVIQNAPFAAATPRVQAVTVPPEGPSDSNDTVLRWDLVLPDAGQYKLFVRLDDPAPFNKDRDLVPQSLQPQAVPTLVIAPPTVNGVLAPGEWPDDMFRKIVLRDIYNNGGGSVPAGGYRDGRLAAATNATHLFLALDVAASSGPDRVRFFLDVGEDKPREISLTQITTGTRHVAEAAVPLSGQPGGLPVGAGGVLRVLAVFEDWLPAGSGSPVRLGQVFQFPWAGREDGEGLQPPDGSQRDEMDSWLPLRLADAAGNAPQRLISLGIGVDRAPPPMLEVDASSCDGLAGWTQSFVRNPPSGGAGTGLAEALTRGYNPDAVKWNCAPYGPDGRPRLYEGRTPNATCEGQPCGQWNRIRVPGGALSSGTPIPPFNVGSSEFVQIDGDIFGRRPNVLVSPPIEIPAIADPYLILRHQYSTEAYINDEPTAASTELYERQPLGSNGEIRTPQKARVHIQEWNEDTQQWATAVLLRPEGGIYTDQETLGISNPAVQGRRLRDHGGQLYKDGWWWPTGEHPFYRPLGSPIVSGQVFSGSPWKVDRIPLFGTHGDQEPPSTQVDSSGKTIRLLFSIPNAPGVPRLGEENPRDFGWRIEGLAVAEGRQFARDLAVTAVQPVTPLYDPVLLGLGPGTPLQVNVTLENRGTQAIEGLRLCVRGIDVGQPPAADPHPCSGLHVEREIGQRLQAGTSSILNLTMTVPNTSGARLSFVAGAFPTTGDDFIADNLLTDGQVFEVRASRNLAVTVGTDQRIAPPGQARSIFVHVENRGNVPVTGFTVQRSVAFEHVGGPTILGRPDTWTADASKPHGTLDVGEAKSLDAIATTPTVIATTDLRMPGVSKPGAYLLSARVQMPGDIDPTDDNAVIVMRTQDILQDGDGKPVAQTFADPSTANGLVVDGTPGVWSVPLGGSLVAGDPATGEIPLAADGTVELTRTPIDLRSARQATLSIKHRYDLEAAPGGGFDAGRVEISTDDGVSWRPLRPEASPLQGLPDGYPSIPITGDSGLAATTGDTPAVAFTGKSADIPGAQDGWIRSQFDLAQDPELSRRTAFDAFSLAGFPATADKRAEGTDGNPDQFFSSDWILREPNAQGRFRYWWIENLTYAPEPHSGSNMWWSGTAGLDNREESSTGDHIDPIDLVQNQLDYAFTAQPAPASLTSGGSTDVLMTWWQWHAGDADGGTGSRQTVSLRNQTATLNRPVLELEQEATGWKRWGVSLNGLENQPLTLRFDYDSAVRPGFTEPATANNRGWFLDDFQQVGYRFDERRQVRHSPTTLTGVDELETVDPRDLEDGTAGPWSTRKVNGAPPRADIVWSLVGQGAGARDGGWKVGPVNVPGQGEVPGWRFADASKQGYPYAAESRLVTPLVDLSQAGGELRLRFDHQYWFEARTTCPLDQVPDADPLVRRSEGCFLSAIDGGAVEYQTFDPATQSFGPWQALAQGFDDLPQRLYFDAKMDDCSAVDKHTVPGDTDPASGPCSSHHRVVDRLTNLAGNRDLASFGGYPAIEERGFRLEGLHELANRIGPILKSPVGHGTSLSGPSQGLSQTQFEVAPGNSGPPPKYTQPWANHPISFVFSGPSKAVHPDTDGWASEAWDVSPLRGKQVRFAFHAASNPGTQSEEGRPSDAADRGWSLANLRVEGDALDGKPVRLRLRVATDSSLGAGEWRIDEAVVAGERFNNNAAILTDGPLEIVADHGATVKFNGRFATLGNGPLQGIVATLSAVRESDLSPHTAVEVKIPSCAPGQPPQTCLAAAIEEPQDVRPEAIAAFRLKPLDLNLQPSIPFSVSVRLPGTDEAVLLRWSLWRDLGGGNYALFPLDVPGNAQAEWVARSLHQESVTFLPPVQGQSRLLVTSPADALPGEKIALAARIENTGTTEPVVKARWTVERVENKGHVEGHVETQPKVANEEPVEVKNTLVTLNSGQKIDRSEQIDIRDSFTPGVAGLYRITLALSTASKSDLGKESVEILVGLPSTYHATDFSAVNAVDAGWLDASVDPRTDGGGSPEDIRFRAADGLFLWGTTDAEFGRSPSQTYCSQPSTCSFAAAKNEGQRPPPTPTPTPEVKGLEGRAFGPAIRLDRVPQGQAFVTLRHNHNFEADDGARIEFLPLDSSDIEAHLPAFPSQSCPGGAVTFTLPPMRLQDHSGVLRSARSVGIWGVALPMTPPQDWTDGETSPDQHNPLLNGTFLNQRAIGGPPARDEVIRYDLSSPAIATCGEPGQPSTLALVNYTVLPILHVGTRPGYVMQESGHPDDIRVGAQGWGIRSIQVSSVAVDASPAAPTYPVQVGAPKTFFITVTNLGQVEDRFGFTIDAPQSTLRSPDWVSLPEPFSLAPGESRRIPVRIDIPANDLGQPGSYLAAIQVYSLSDPFTTDTVAARVDVRRVLLPDLALTLTSDLPTGDGFEAGKVYPVHATIFNIGGAVSRPTELLLETVDAAGGTRLVERLSVARLCPPGGQSNPSDGCQASRATLTVEWAAPQQPGAYRLVGRVDPAGVIDEDSESNNVADLGADVSPLNEPALAVTDLKLQGVTAGVAEEGSLVVVTANATNFGNSPAHNVRVKIRFGSSTLREVFLPTLDPGQQVTVSAAKVVSRGQFIVGASITHDAVDANIDDDDLRLPLRVRGHELALATQPANFTVLPGGTVAFRLNITNHGNSVERAAIRLDPAARGWAIRVLPNPLTIAPDQTGNTSIELTAPSDALAGPTIVWLLATPSGHAPSVARLAVPLTITARPEVPTLDVANQTVHPGNTTILVSINSTSNAAQTVVLELESPTWAPASVPVALAARANRTVSLPLAVPANATVGSHELTLLLRDAQGIALSRHSALVNVTGRAAASAAWSGAAQREGDELGIRRATFTLRISNDGNLPLTPRLALRGLGEGISATDIPVGPVLAPGETWRAPVAVLLAPNATAPFGLAEVWIHSGDNATQRAAVLALPGLDAAPDLHVAFMQMSPRVLQVGRAAYVSASVENRGGVEAPASTLFVSVNGYLVEPVGIPAIPAGSSHAFNVTVTFTEAGSYLVSLLADGDENLTELEDADNGRSLNVEVGKPGVVDRLQTPDASFAALTLALLALVAAARRRRGGSA